MQKPTAESVHMVNEEMTRVREFCKANFGFLIYPEIKWDIRGTHLHGQAIGERTVRFNPALALVNLTTFKTTITHEFAHVIVNALRRIKPTHPLLNGDLTSSHGSAWRRMMQALGIGNPQRCITGYTAEEKIAASISDNGVSNVYVYACEQCGKRFAFSKRRHNASMRGRYFHKEDGGILKFVDGN